MSKEQKIICEECEKEAEFDSPAKLCEEHWLKWWNEVDETVCIGQFTNEFHFLSNFHESPIIHKGIVYPSVEHYYQAQKTKDEAKQRKIASYRSPSAAKRMGRKLKLRKDWDSIKVDVMREGLKKKFTKDSFFAKLLVATHPAKLEEGNWWGDLFWGVNHKTRKGQNWLGRLLMERRKQLLELERHQTSEENT